MKRLVVKCSDGNMVNIQADRLQALEQDPNFIVALSEGEIVGVFDMANITMLYLSGDKDK